MPRTERYRNWIGGQWTPAATGETYENRNPADQRDLIGLFAESSEKEIDEAVAAAREAFPAWKGTPAPKRGEILFRAAQLLSERKDEIARDMTREMGKILTETLADVQEAIDMASWMAGEGRRLYGQTMPSELRDKLNMTLRVPIGVAGLITPWNFPIAIPSWKSFPALICGNTCVLKPAPDSPASAVHFARVLEEAGLPKGVFNLVTGTSGRLGEALVEHRQIPVVSFTGSTETGRLVSEKCARAFKRLHLEMGGKNAILVLEDADLELAVDGALWGAFGTSGQRCTASSRLIVHGKVYRRFVKSFVGRVRRLRVGDGLDPRIEMGPVISRTHLDRILEWIEVAKEEGARLLSGGGELRGRAYRNGFFLEPTVFGEVRPEMKVAQEEIFGPVVCILPCSSFEEGLEIANGVRFGLSSAIYTRDINRAFKAMQTLDTGIFYVNSPTIGAETHLPFGGTRETGNGHREAGEAALDVFSEWKTVYIDFSGRLQRAQID